MAELISSLDLLLHLSSSPYLYPLMTLTLVFFLGFISQILSEKTALPGILFLLFFGSVLGKYGLQLINPDVFGNNGLRALIAICVAIVVFEGGLLIDIKFFRDNWVSVLGLITINVLVTILGMAWVTHSILGISWEISLLYAALISVTGPTVIAPILKRLHLRNKVKVILETEAVLVDAIGVIAAVSIFNFVLATAHGEATASTQVIIRDIFISLVLGAFSGGFCALTARYFVKTFSPLRGEVTRVLVLLTAISAYTLGEITSHESGITAVAVAGFLIGNMEFPHKHSIKEFKGDLTLISITLVFLLLAASLDMQFLAKMGLKGALVVLILMLIVRPVGVLLSTIFEKISWRERLFIASLGPRGIVAASAATFFAIELDSAGIEGASAIRGLVFMTVLLTVIIQGSGARFMAKILEVAPPSTLVVGAGTIGKQLILQLKFKGHSDIIVIEQDIAKIEALQHLSHQGVYFINEDARKEALFKHQLNQLQNVHTIIATTYDDWLNLRVCQIAKKFSPEITAISILNDIKGRDVFENLDIHSINIREAAATVISMVLDQPRRLQHMPPRKTSQLNET